VFLFDISNTRNKASFKVRSCSSLLNQKCHFKNKLSIKVRSRPSFLIKPRDLQLRQSVSGTVSVVRGNAAVTITAWNFKSNVLLAGFLISSRVSNGSPLLIYSSGFWFSVFGLIPSPYRLKHRPASSCLISKYHWEVLYLLKCQVRRTGGVKGLLGWGLRLYKAWAHFRLWEPKNWGMPGGKLDVLKISMPFVGHPSARRILLL